MQLFDKFVDEKKLSTVFKTIRDNNDYLPVKMTLEEIFANYNDIDGNFIEQFQTTGFNARLLELYFYQYFKECNFKIDRSHQYPDFIVNKRNISVAVEITTANGQHSNTGGVTINESLLNGTYEPESDSEYEEKLHNEIPIRFSSAIFNKLKKRYWENDHCKDMPFVIALSGFFEELSLNYSFSSLCEILYGKKIGFEDGYFSEVPVHIHKFNGKDIPSALYFAPNTDWKEIENISAIIFQNSASIAKFRRMGWYNDYYNSLQIIGRKGFAADNNKYATLPRELGYTLDSAPFHEQWGNDLVILHNPNAKKPIPKGYFENALDIWIEDGQFQSKLPKHTVHFFNSTTQVFAYQLLKPNQSNIENITKYEFYKIANLFKNIDFKNSIEMYWYKTSSNILGTIYSTQGKKYGFKILSKISTAKSYTLTKNIDSFNTIDLAATNLFDEMSKL